MLDPHRMIATLARCETMPRKELRAFQTAILEPMLRKARDHVPGCSDRLDVIFKQDGSFDFDKWAQLPVLTKDELIALGDDKFDGDLPDALKPIEWSATSGTTGKPFLAARTQFALFVSACINERMIEWAGLDGSRPLATIRYSTDTDHAYPRGKTTRGWSLKDPTAHSHTLSHDASVDQQIDWLRRVRPTYLCSYPSVAAEIANTLGPAARDLGLEAVLTFGEAVLPEHEEAIVDGLGSKLVDAYSAQEAGFIALRCPKSSDYHVVNGAMLLEVADDQGKPLPAGEEGEILLTPFHNAVMPLIRYRIGDRGVMAAGKCACGRTGPRLKSIGGRSRDMFHFPDGSKRFANIPLPDLQAAVPMQQYQLIQHAPADVELLYIPDRQIADARVADLDGLQRLARRYLHPSVTLRVSPVDRIDRTKAGKFPRTLRLF